MAIHMQCQVLAESPLADAGYDATWSTGEVRSVVNFFHLKNGRPYDRMTV